MLNTCKKKISTFFLILYFSFQIQDSTFQFEKRRNVPVKYNRELWSKTGLFVIISLLSVFFFVKVLISLHLLPEDCSHEPLNPPPPPKKS